MTFLPSLFLAFAFSLSLTAQAKVIQILHTNDLHSYFMGTRGGIGGYAQMKEVLDGLREEANKQGIPTLHLDAGDFGEGSSFYFADHGVASLKALDILGVDVAVIGNHDFILGGKEFRNQMQKAELKTKMLSANMMGKRFMGLKNYVKDYVDYNFDGVKLRVFGLTTNEIHFMYPLRPLGYIAHPHRVGVKQATKARKAGVDFTIALTHIGLADDIRLVEKTRTIDMVVGGHTHTLLTKPQLTKNLEGRLIPILQAGAHAGYIGKMIVDIKKDGEPEMLEYQIINVTQDMPANPEMNNFVQDAYQKREEYFGRSWDEVIGETEITLSGNYNGQDTQPRTCWSRHLARMTRVAANAELGLQFDVFQGEQILPGPVRFGDIVDNFPHFRRWGDNGWNVSRATVSGFLLKRILDMLASSDVALQVTVDGIKALDKSGKTVPYDPTIHRSSQAVIDGYQISNLRYYSIALPSEVPYGAVKLFNIFGHVLFKKLRNIPDSGYWNLIEKYIKENSPLRCLED